MASLLGACQKAVPVPPPTPAPAPTPTPAPTRPATTPTLAPTPDSLRTRVARLLRRAGFGASKAELDRFEAIGLGATVSHLLEYENVSDTSLETRLESLGLDLTKSQDLQRWWLLRMIYTQRPLQEKMTLFWHSLLTSGMSRVGQADFMLRQNQLFRQQAMGSFPDLLKAVSRDPAMLIWLDSRSNRKSAPNENFARELMELFTMGVGNYSEDDVRESARAFTGWFLRGNDFSFEPSQHDNGAKIFLGELGSFFGDDIVDIIVKKPATSEFICRKLFSFFTYDSVDANTVSRMRRAYESSGYSIKAAMRELLPSEAFLAADERRVRPKSPAELVVGMVRSLAIETDASGLPALMTRMGQTLFDPPDVAGWPRSAWINSSTLLERINFANRATTDRRSFNPLADVAKPGGTAPKEIVDYFSDLLLGRNVAPAKRQVLYDRAQAFFNIGSADDATRAVVYLILSSPDYQLV